MLYPVQDLKYVFIETSRPLASLFLLHEVELVMNNEMLKPQNNAVKERHACLLKQLIVRYFHLPGTGVGAEGVGPGLGTGVGVGSG